MSFIRDTGSAHFWFEQSDETKDLPWWAAEHAAHGRMEQVYGPNGYLARSKPGYGMSAEEKRTKVSEALANVGVDAETVQEVLAMLRLDE